MDTPSPSSPPGPSSQVSGPADADCLAGWVGPAGTEGAVGGSSVWRLRTFRLLWAGETTSALGTGVGAVALGVLAVVLGAGPWTVAVLEAAVWAPWLLIGLPAGAWVDRLPARAVMVWCDVCAALVFASVPVAAALGVLGLPQLLVVALLAGAVNVLSQAARATYPPKLLPARYLGSANAALEGAESAALLGAAPLSGAVTHLLGAVGGVGANAVSYVVSVGCLLGIGRVGRGTGANSAGCSFDGTAEPLAPAQERTTSLGQEIRLGARVLMRDPYLRTLALGAGVANFVLTGVGALTPLFLIEDLGVSPAAVGPLLLGEGLGGVAGAAVALPSARRIGSARCLLLMALLLPPLGLGVPLAQPGWGLLTFFVGGFAITAGVVATNVIAATFRQRWVPTGLLGRVSATGRVIAYAAAPVGALSAGALAAVIGVRAALVLMTTLGMLRALLYVISPLRRNRDLPSGHLSSHHMGP